MRNHLLLFCFVLFIILEAILPSKVLARAEIALEKPTEKYVGIFYFVWLGQHSSEQKGNYDITELLAHHPGDLFNKQGTPLSPLGQYHFWGEPLYGYYNSADPWIITRHIELFAQAGIDYILIDATNSFYYPEVMTVLLDQLLRFQQQGHIVPQVAFYTNSSSGTTVQRIYEHFYKPRKYEDVWFKPEGKPLIVGITPNNQKASDQLLNPDFNNYISDELIAYFDIRESQWPTGTFNPEAFPWISWDYPQKNHNGVISVSVGQHSPVNVVFSDTTFAKGRGYDAVLGKNIPSLARDGKNFRDQWETVLKNKDQVDNVFITGWNEWIAIKMIHNEKVAFVDAFNEEFSRDVEMMKGGYGDHFYRLMAENIQKFKGKREKSVRAEISIDFKKNDLSQWEKAVCFRDFTGDALIRNFQDFSGQNRYYDASARNDIVEIRVANDKKNVYFLIRTDKDILPPDANDRNWMNILIGTSDSDAQFMDYHFILNRFPQSDGKSSIEKSQGGYHWEKIGAARYRIFGSNMIVSVPMKVLGLRKDSISFRFKVTDHVTHCEDPMDYYISGDCAPIGGMSYYYGD